MPSSEAPFPGASAVLCALLAAACGPTPAERAAAENLKVLTQELEVPATERFTVRTLGCNLSPNAQVLVDGAMDIAGVGALLEFRGTADPQRTQAVTSRQGLGLLRELTGARVPAEARSYGPALDADMFAQVLDGQGLERGPPIALGRCGAGGGAAQLEGTVGALATLRATSLDCDAGGGPVVTVEGTVSFHGVRVRFPFLALEPGPDGSHRTIGAPLVELVRTGRKVAIAPQTLRAPSLDAVLWASFLDSQGTPLTEPVELGRCGQPQGE